MDDGPATRGQAIARKMFCGGRTMADVDATASGQTEESGCDEVRLLARLSLTPNLTPPRAYQSAGLGFAFPLRQDARFSG
jgi:hypothetical protein